MKVNLSDSPRQTVLSQVNSIFPREKWKGVRTLVAVSGGPDSVALLRALAESERRSCESNQSDLVVVHVNHGIRGSESERDAEFVRDLANGLQLECHLVGGSGEEVPTGVSEEALRDFRYEQLQMMATRLGARYLVMGHHLDDQVETILFRVFRGTGIAGLAGIPPIRLVNESLTIVRPFAGTSRAEIEAYLQAIDQPFCVDPSNAHSQYARNFLRNELLPQLKSRWGDPVIQAIARLGEQAREVDDFLMSHLVELDGALVSSSPDQVEIDCARIATFPSVLVRRWLAEIWKKQGWPRQAMTFEWWQQIDGQIRAGGEARVVLNLPANIRFEKEGASLKLFKEER